MDLEGANENARGCRDKRGSHSSIFSCSEHEGAPFVVDEHNSSLLCGLDEEYDRIEERRLEGPREPFAVRRRAAWKVQWRRRWRRNLIQLHNISVEH